MRERKGVQRTLGKRGGGGRLLNTNGRGGRWSQPRKVRLTAYAIDSNAFLHSWVHEVL
jgi:hypothetical protein